MAASIGAACASVRLPVGPGEEDPEAAIAAFQDIERLCPVVTIDPHGLITAAVSVRGTSQGRPIRGRVWVGADHVKGSLRIESADGVPPRFVLTAARAHLGTGDVTDRDVTLYLPREGLIVTRESSRALLQAVLGLPLSREDFVSVFTGCGQSAGHLEGRSYGPTLVRMSVAGAVPVERLFRRRNSQSPWRLLAMSQPVPGHAFKWRAEYDQPVGSSYRAIRIVGEENGGTGRLFDVHLALDRVQVVPLVEAATFLPTVPASARSVALEFVQQQRSQPSLPLLND